MSPFPPPGAVVTRRFRAEPEVIFNAWVKPELLAKWLSAVAMDTASGRFLSAKLNPEVGGRFELREQRSEGEITRTGEYLALERPRHLSFTWAIPQYSADVDRVIVDIEKETDGSRVVVQHLVEPRDAADFKALEQRWAVALDALASALGEPAVGGRA